MYLFIDVYFLSSLALAFDMSWHFYLGLDIYQWHDDMSQCLLILPRHLSMAQWPILTLFICCTDNYMEQLHQHRQLHGTMMSPCDPMWVPIILLDTLSILHRQLRGMIMSAQAIAWNDCVSIDNHAKQFCHLVTACESQCNHNGYFPLFFV